MYPNDFRGFWKFIEEYFIIEDQQVYQRGQLRQFKTYEKFKPGKEKELQQLLDEISTQRKRKEVMEWLPDKYYEQIKLECTPAQTKYLEELNNSYRTEHITTTGTLDRLVRYRQICLDPELIGLKSKSPKTEWIKQYIKDKSLIIMKGQVNMDTTNIINESFDTTQKYTSGFDYPPS